MHITSQLLNPFSASANHQTFTYSLATLGAQYGLPSIKSAPFCHLPHAAQNTFFLIHLLEKILLPHDALNEAKFQELHTLSSLFLEELPSVSLSIRSYALNLWKINGLTALEQRQDLFLQMELIRLLPQFIIKGMLDPFPSEITFNVIYSLGYHSFGDTHLLIKNLLSLLPPESHQQFVSRPTTDSPSLENLLLSNFRKSEKFYKDTYHPPFGFTIKYLSL